jgi:hypothetical protein
VFPSFSFASQFGGLSRPHECITGSSVALRLLKDTFEVEFSDIKILCLMDGTLIQKGGIRSRCLR